MCACISPDEFRAAMARFPGVARAGGGPSRAIDGPAGASSSHRRRVLTLHSGCSLYNGTQEINNEIRLGETSIVNVTEVCHDV